MSNSNEIIDNKGNKKSVKRLSKNNKKSKKIANKKILKFSNRKQLVLFTSKKANKRTKTKKEKIDSLLNVDLTKKYNISEYYDLPSNYNKTVVKVLFQTPDTLFVYWNISDEDYKSFENKYGNSFFYNTRPVLIVTNVTKNYSFEIEINDFANSWYFHIDDSNCKYRAELGRRPIYFNDFQTDYIFITSSNTIEAPNDHILFENIPNTIQFRNVKTNQIYSKSIGNFSSLKTLNKFYKEIYNNEDFTEDSKIMGNSSSVFK